MPRRKAPPPVPDPRDLEPGTPIIGYARASTGPKQNLSVPDQVREICRHVQGCS